MTPSPLVLLRFIAVYLLRVDRTPRDGEMFPRHWITLFDLSRAIVVLRFGVMPGGMWTDVKGRTHHHDDALCVRADVTAADAWYQYSTASNWIDLFVSVFQCSMYVRYWAFNKD